MKDLSYLDVYRVPMFGDLGDEYNGAFKIKVRTQKYNIIASNGGGWDHVSVSHKDRVPSWEVMNTIKEMFFEDNEVVMQLHPKKSEYVNQHPNCLHLWRPINNTIPTPPTWMVGMKDD